MTYSPGQRSTRESIFRETYPLLQVCITTSTSSFALNNTDNNNRLNTSGYRLRRWMRILLLGLSLIILRARPTTPLRRSLNQMLEGVTATLAGHPTHDRGGRFFLCISGTQLCPVPWDHRRQRWLSARASRVHPPWPSLLLAVAQDPDQPFLTFFFVLLWLGLFVDMYNVPHVANPTNHPVAPFMESKESEEFTHWHLPLSPLLRRILCSATLQCASVFTCHMYV